jgi:hypothetical protein
MDTDASLSSRCFIIKFCFLGLTAASAVLAWRPSQTLATCCHGLQYAALVRLTLVFQSGKRLTEELISAEFVKK